MVTVVSGFPAPDRAAESSGLSMLFRSKDAMRGIVLPLILTGLDVLRFLWQQGHSKVARVVGTEAGGGR